MPRNPPRPPIDATAGAEDAFVPPAGLRASVLTLGTEEFAILEWSAPAPALPPTLTRSEREVALLVLEGLSNAEIARRRGRSLRTIANQVESTFHKLGVRSRAELAALTRRGGPGGRGSSP